MGAPDVLAANLSPDALREVLLAIARACACCDPDTPSATRSSRFHCEELEDEA